MLTEEQLDEIELRYWKPETIVHRRELILRMGESAREDVHALVAEVRRLRACVQEVASTGHALALFGPDDYEEAEAEEENEGEGHEAAQAEHARLWKAFEAACARAGVEGYETCVPLEEQGAALVLGATGSAKQEPFLLGWCHGASFESWPKEYRGSEDYAEGRSLGAQAYRLIAIAGRRHHGIPNPNADDKWSLKRALQLVDLLEAEDEAIVDDELEDEDEEATAEVLPGCCCPPGKRKRCTKSGWVRCNERMRWLDEHDPKWRERERARGQDEDEDDD